ncbi:MAG: polysaccharide biosynthesis tyrosine autokinase, partial [Actinobacteria bacterium]|nr:polysaccharide biosynthesis tyrosine autokinase [Actinomycetota bacterium]
MTLHEYVAILRRSWPIIAVSAVVGVLITLAFSLTATKVYQAQSQLFVSVKSADGVGDAYSGGLFVQQRVKSYVDVVDSPAVLDPVITELGLDMTYTGLAKKVSAQTPPNTVLLNVIATDTDPNRAAEISNAVAASFADEISRLEGGDPEAADQGGTNPNPVQASVIKPAEVPTTPVSPRTRINVLLGLLLGLAIGVGVAVLRHTLDTSVKSVEDLEDASQTVALGAISLDPEAQGSPLVTLRGSARAEAFRSIRTNLQYVDVDNPPKSVVITSSMPSEGKSTTACNLAIALAQAGARVLLMEADLRRPKIAEYLQVDGSRGLTDLLIGKATLNQTIIPWQRGLINFLPAGAIPPNPSELLGSHQMSSLLAYLTQHHDMVVIDAPPLLPVTDAAILATVADGAILIARHGVTSKEQLEESSEALRQVNARILGA